MGIDVSRGPFRQTLLGTPTANRAITFPDASGVIHLGGQDFFDVKAYGALGDGVTNDTVAIQAAIDAVPATGGTVWLPAGVYVVNGTLTILDKPNLTLRGQGAVGDIHGAAPTTGTVLKRVSGVGTLLSVGSNAAARSVSDINIEGLSIDGNNLAATGLLITSVYGGTFRDLHLRSCTTVALDGTTKDLSALEDTQHCLFQNIGITQTTGIGMRLGSYAAGGGNVSICNFENIIIRHTDGVGAQLNDCDTNTFVGFTTARAAGTGIGIEMRGSNHASSGHCRHNTFVGVQPGPGGVTVRGTATYSLPPSNNIMLGYSTGNSSPLPVVEAGATLRYETVDGLIQSWRIPNNVAMQGRNALDTAYVNLFSINVLNELSIDAIMRITQSFTIGDGKNIVLGTTNGTMIGSGSTQKVGFHGITPVAQQGNTTDLRQLLINYGFLLTGGASPLNLNGGALTAGNATVSGALTLHGGASTAWAAYTPTWSGGVSAIGDATVDFRWSQIGKTVFVEGIVTFGSTTTFAAANITATLPVAAATSSFPMGTGQLFDSSTGEIRLCAVVRGASSTVRWRISGTGSAAFEVSNTNPWTWTTSDVISFSFTYEAA